jgi:hypothetical protein
MGDFNAQVEKEDRIKRVAGKYTMHESTNNNGKLMLNFAIENEMLIASTIYQHKNIHKGTWVSPDG